MPFQFRRCRFRHSCEWRGLDLLGPSRLDFLGPSGPRFLGPSVPRFLGPLLPRFLGPSGLDFLVHSGARFLRPLGGSIHFWSFEGSIFLVHFGGSIFLVFRGLELLVHLGLEFLVGSGARFFLFLSRARFSWSFRASIFFGPSGARFFMITFGDPLLGRFGARLLLTSTGWTCVIGLVCSFSFSHLRTCNSDSRSSPLFLFL